MKVKFSHEFKDHKGNPITHGGEKQCTLKDIALDCLLFPTAKDFPDMGGVQKVRNHDLAVNIMNFGDNAELNSEDCSIIKEMIGHRYTPIVVAQSYAILESRALPNYNEVSADVAAIR